MRTAGTKAKAVCTELDLSGVRARLVPDSFSVRTPISKDIYI